jgi:cell wall-associated NlpC family hydrolase
VNVSGYEGETAEISVKAEGDVLSYQWQWSDDGLKWNDSSIQRSSGQVKVRSENNGRKYRCVITDRYGSKVISDTLTVTMRKRPVITRQPEDISGDEGTIVKISVKAEGEGLSYQWQWSDDVWKWTDSTNRKASGSVRIRTENDGRKYRCVITDRYGTSMVSDALTITMNWTLSPEIKELIAFGKKYLGTPYVFGGTSLTKGLDCSSFTQQCFAHIGIKLERTSYWQVNQGAAVSLSRSTWKPGDLIFYNVDGKIGHVAIYIGGGKILQSAQSVGGVCISDYNYNGNVPVKVRRFVND